MTEEEIQKNSEHWYNKYKDAEKRIAELEEELGQENERLKNRNAELKGMYAHSAREAGTYKQFFERERKENEKLTKENRLLGERCNQLLKDKGDLTDQIADIKDNCAFALEGKNIKIKELELRLEQTEKDLADYQFNYPTIKELEKEKINSTKHKGQK